MEPALKILPPHAQPRLVHQLRRACLPGPLAGRALLAGGLPTWLSLMMAIVFFALSAELIAYIYSVAQTFLQVIYDQWSQAFEIPAGAPWIFLEVAMQQARPHVFAGLTDSVESLAMFLGGLACIAGLLESLNLVMLAPLGASYGQPLGRAASKTRRVLLSLGGLWLLEYSLLWTVLFLGAGVAELYFAKTLRVRISYLTLDNMMHLGFGVILLLMLLAWLVRLMWAASYLAETPETPLPPRCGRCGYLLHGLPEGSCCPDCGQANPSGPDGLRRPSPWLERRRTGRVRAVARVSSQVLQEPKTFFAHLQVLCNHREALRFVRWNLWQCVGIWVVAVPGIASAMIAPDEFAVANKVISAAFMTGLVALGLALVGTLLLGLIVSLMGFAIGIMREEPSWPIAAEAGCYLSAWLPRVAVAQALWVTMLFTVERLTEQGLFVWLAQHAWINSGIPWEVVLSLMFGLPVLVGVGLMIRAAIVCYRGVRYACR